MSYENDPKLLTDRLESEISCAIGLTSQQQQKSEEDDDDDDDDDKNNNRKDWLSHLFDNSW